MSTQKFRGQSYKWPSWEFEFPGNVPGRIENVRLLQTKAGNLTRIKVLEGGQWSGVAITFSGNVSVSDVSKGETIIGLASSGSWSGGSNYSGYIFGKPGAVVFLGVKGNKKWLVFDEGGGYHYESIKPGTAPVEL